jgi:hypothetical protein
VSAITDKVVALNKCILMYDDETLREALLTWRETPDHYDWWHLVVSLEDGGYAVARFADLAHHQDRLDEPLRTLVGGALKQVEVVVDQDAATLEATQSQAGGSASQVAVVERDGEFAGVLPVGSRRGVFNSSLVNLAGELTPLPEGVFSPRRLKAKSKKRETAPSQESTPKESSRKDE